MRQTVTIPAAGKEKIVKITGRSVIIEQAGVYDSASDVPLIQFRPGNNQYPIYPRSTYQNTDGIYNSIVIVGTEESEGDEITLLSTDECLPSEINIIFTASYRATTKPAQSYDSTNDVQSFSDAQLINDEGNLPSVVYVSARGENIAWSIQADPVQGASGLGSVLTAGDNPIPIEGINFIKGFRYISETADTHGTLHVIFEY